MTNTYPTGVHSGQVMTVLGPIPTSEMGITLTHEHILCDFGCNGPEPAEATRKFLFHRPLSMDILGEVRLLPMCNRDNQRLTDPELAVSEVEKYRWHGGKTILEMTLDGGGRDPLGLEMVSRRTGVAVVMGTGFYIEASHPERVRRMSIDNIAEEIVQDLSVGVANTGVRAGVIGEIGIDQDFSAEEEKSLRGAARAAHQTLVPMAVHTPGGMMRVHKDRMRILDILEEEGADIDHVIVNHVQLYPRSIESQLALAERGAYLGYDGISCDFDWGKRGRGQADESAAADIKTLIDAGFLHKILLSHDVHLKVMTTAYGGWGYAYILKSFVHRLKSYGITDEQIHVLLQENPRQLFSP